MEKRRFPTMTMFSSKSARARPRLLPTTQVSPQPHFPSPGILSPTDPGSDILKMHTSGKPQKSTQKEILGNTETGNSLTSGHKRATPTVQPDRNATVFPNPYLQKITAGNMVVVGNHHFVIRSFSEQNPPSKK